MRILRRLLPAALVLAMVSPVAQASAAPAASTYWYRGPCAGSSGPLCYFWKGKVTFVDDGDTVDVDIAGDGTATPKRVRFSGVNAMEMHTYSSVPARWTGECNAVAATKLVYSLINGKTVRLAAQDPTSASGSRPRRQISYYAGGGWHDLGALLMQRGLAVLDDTNEYVWSKPYEVLQQRAATAHVGLFNTNSCGSDSTADALRLWVKSNANGNDSANLNDEWVRIRNDRDVAVPIGGWWVRDGGYRGTEAHGFTFPSGAVIKAHGEVTLHVGSGSNTATNFYWRQSVAIFQNSTGAPRNAGDGAYLFDRRGDMRAWMTYPCYYACGTPADGNLTVTRSVPGQYVDVRNTSATRTVALEGFVLYKYDNSYPFSAADVLGPHQTLRLYLGTGSGGADITRSWRGVGGKIYTSGGAVEVDHLNGRRIVCTAWGTKTC